MTFVLGTPTPATAPTHSFTDSLKKALRSLMMTQLEFLRYGFYLVAGIVLMYFLACLIRAAGLPGVNLALAGIIGLTGAVIWFSPIPLLAAIGIGSLTAASKKVTIDQGVKQGLEVLGRMAATSILFTAMVFGFYGTWPGDLTMAHYLIGLSGPVILTWLIIYDKVEMKGKWFWWVGGSYTGAIMMWYFGTSLPFVNDFVNDKEIATLNKLAAVAAGASILAWLYFRIQDKAVAKTFMTLAFMTGLLWIMGANNIPTLVDTARTTTTTGVDKLHNLATTGDFDSPVEKAAKQKADATEAEAKRKADLAAAKQAAEDAAAVQTVVAAANAKAAEAARLTEEVSRDLPTTIRVPLCKQDDGGNTEVDSMSTPVQIPAKWGFVAAWKVGSTPFAVLKDGEWKVATSFSDMGDIDAIRFCTNSSAHAELGDMSLSWYAK